MLARPQSPGHVSRPVPPSASSASSSSSSWPPFFNIVKDDLIYVCHRFTFLGIPSPRPVRQAISAQERARPVVVDFSPALSAIRRLTDLGTLSIVCKPISSPTIIDHHRPSSTVIKPHHRRRGIVRLLLAVLLPAVSAQRRTVDELMLQLMRRQQRQYRKLQKLRRHKQHQ
jgi:hypothetical protein